MQHAVKVNRSLLSIDYASKLCLCAGLHSPLSIPLENIEASDYLQEGDIGFKKPKACFLL